VRDASSYSTTDQASMVSEIMTTSSALYGYGRAVHTLEIDVAARAGCRFYACLLSKLLKDALPDTLRKIEHRLKSLDDERSAFLSVQNWGAYAQSFQGCGSVHLPGTATDANSQGMQILDSVQWKFLASSGEFMWVLPFKTPNLWSGI